MSTPKSTNTADAAAPIRPTVAHRKPKADLYTILLIVSLLAVLLGILFLYLFNRDYEFKYKGAPKASISRPASGLAVTPHGVAVKDHLRRAV